jgi:hypothetical protein
MTYEVVGRTVLGKDIMMFKIGNPNGGRVLFDGAIHGGETIGPELLVFYAKWLLNGSDLLAQRILLGTYTLIIPALNVDRYSGPRKNMNGVDLNRNFATDWNHAGSTDPNSESYRGPAPLSEPESQTLVHVLQTFKPDFYVNLHMWASPYYAGSSYGNRTYYSTLTNEINSLSSDRGVTPLRYSGQFSGPGFAISDAARAGVTSYLIELAETAIPYADIERVLLPKFIPLAGVLSQESAHYISPPWDVNRDGLVSMSDLAIVVKAFGAGPGDLNWNSAADVDKNDYVNTLDLYIVSSHYGEQY